MVRTRRRGLARRAHGRVLDLGGAASHPGLWPTVPAVTEAVVLDGSRDPRLLALAREGPAFDTVFSVFQLVSTPDLDATLERIRGVLRPHGHLLFLEPTRRVGAPGRAQALVAPAVGLATGWRLDRDVPGSIRGAGLTIIDLERVRFPTTQWWLRAGVEGRARSSSGSNPQGAGPLSPR